MHVKDSVYKLFTTLEKLKKAGLPTDFKFAATLTKKQRKPESPCIHMSWVYGCKWYSTVVKHTVIDLLCALHSGTQQVMELKERK